MEFIITAWFGKILRTVYNSRHSTLEKVYLFWKECVAALSQCWIQGGIGLTVSISQVNAQPNEEKME